MRGHALGSDRKDVWVALGPWARAAVWQAFYSSAPRSIVVGASVCH